MDQNPYKTVSEWNETQWVVKLWIKDYMF